VFQVRADSKIIEAMVGIFGEERSHYNASQVNICITRLLHLSTEYLCTAIDTIEFDGMEERKELGIFTMIIL
jgi:hypothetical protein